MRDTAVRDSMPSTTSLEYQRERMRNMSSIADDSANANLKHLTHVTADAMDVAITAVFTARTGVARSNRSGSSHRA